MLTLKETSAEIQTHPAQRQFGASSQEEDQETIGNTVIQRQVLPQRLEMVKNPRAPENVLKKIDFYLMKA